jgi:hypothetical protein
MKIDSKLKQDIRMIQMRNYMDPKRYAYERTANSTKYFHKALLYIMLYNFQIL